MKVEELLSQSGEWLKGTGPEGDVIISSRLRLARNLSRFPFLSMAPERVRGEIEKPESGFPYLKIAGVQILPHPSPVECPIKAERERCAKVVEGYNAPVPQMMLNIAKKIRETAE